jgi:hypothetical protein
MTTTVTTTQTMVSPARLRIQVPPAVRHMVRRLTNRTTNSVSGEAPPTGLPGALPPGQATPADDYTRGAAIWAYIAGRWLPAHVTEIDASSVLVTYEVPGTGETSLEVVHRSHLAPRGQTSKTPEPATSTTEAAGQARATLLVHHADEHGMCKGCADLAHFCWAPCPAARDAMRIIGQHAEHLAGAR